MKKGIILLFCITSLFFKTFSQNDVKINNDTMFQQQLSTVISKVKAMKDFKEMYGYINELKRLSAINQKEWLSEYYISYFELKLSLIAEPEKKEDLLNDAKQRIDSLLNKSNAIESEVQTLLGYFYYMKIASDPNKNGQLYYKDVITAYQKAIALNENNPRPHFLLTLFENNMNVYMGNSNDQFCNNLNKNLLLFKSFVPINTNDPSWGERELNKTIDENCKK